MKRKTEQIAMAGIMGIMFFFYIGYSLLADVYTMTDEQYACEAQRIVNCGHMPCYSSTDTANCN